MLLELIVMLHAFMVALHIVLPFARSTLLLLLHIVIATGQLSHWLQNDDVCFLSKLEASLRGCDLKDTLFNAFFEPIYSSPWQTQLTVAALLAVSCARLYLRAATGELGLCAY